MVDWAIIKRLMRFFPDSFINANGEIIVHREANEYFVIRTCETVFDVKCKVLEWLSRAAHKTSPFPSERKNRKFQDFILSGINGYLETTFTREDMDLIYTYLGNACNHALTVRFVQSGYNMEILKEREANA